MPYINKKITLLLLSLSFVIFLTDPAVAGTTVDRIVAQVNREVITLSELEARLKGIPQGQKAGATGDIRRQVLDLMIEQELVNQEAKHLGIMVSENEVNAAISSIMDENKLSESQFKGTLTASGTTLTAFRSDLKMEILKNKVLGLSVMSRIVITDQEVDAFLRGEGARFLSSGQVSDLDRVLMIFLGATPKTVNKVMEQAQKIKSEIEGGLTFSEAAARYSEGPGRDNGGDTGTNLTVGDLQPQLQELARQLGHGQVSEPLNGGNSVILVTIVAAPNKEPKTSESRASKDDFSDQERNQARRQLEKLKMQQKYQTWITDLKARANIRISL